MNVKIDNTEKNIVLMEIELEEAIFEEAMQKSFLKNKNRFTVPGFRKGKAPRALVQRFYGEAALYEDAVEAVWPDAYEKAIKQENILPVSRPEIDVKQIGAGKIFIFTAKVAIKPEVEIDDYIGVEVVGAKYEVNEKQIDNEIEKQRKKSGRMLTIDDRSVENGDIVNIDFEGLIDGTAFKGGKAEGQDLVIGSGQFIPGFEEQLVGRNIGDQTEISVRFPDDYHAGEMAGKEALFKVTVNSIKKEELPEADDEFAKDVSEFETLKEYRMHIEEDLIKKSRMREKNENEAKVVNKLLEKAKMDIPKMMIEERVEAKIREYNNRLSYQGMSLESYLMQAGTDMTSYKEHIEEDIVSGLRTQLMLDAISKKEDIQATEEDIEHELAAYAEQIKQKVSSIKESMSEEELENIKSVIIARKTVEFLVSKAVFIEETEKKEE